MTLACATDDNHSLSVAAGAQLVGAQAAVFVRTHVRRCKQIKVSSLLLRGWFDQVIPLAVELVSLQIDLLHLLVGHFAPDRIFSSIQSARNLQALRRRRRSNQVDDRLIVPQWLTAPIG